MFSLSKGDFGVHKSLGKVKVCDVSPDAIWVENVKGDRFRVSLERAPSIIIPSKYSNASTNLDFGGVQEEEDFFSKPAQVLGEYEGWAKRPYQTEALKALTASFKKHNRVILALPTGSGKTFVAAKWICDHVLSAGGKVAWVAHRTELLDQAHATFLKILPPSMANSITWWAGGKEKNPYGKIVLVSIAASRGFPDLSFDLLVIDEAHHEPANTYQTFQSSITFKKSLGLTATPKRLDEKILGYDDIAYQKTFMSLVKEKWLSCPVPVLPQTGMCFELETRMDDFSEESLSSLDTDNRNTFIVEHWYDNKSKYGKTLVFALNRDHARRLESCFKEKCNNTRVEYIVSGDGNFSERQRKVSLFRNGNIDVLINCKIFTEGFDCPDVKTVFITRPTLSVSLYLQMIGRGTRVTSNKTSFYLVDFQDNLSKFQQQLIRPWVLGEEFRNLVVADKEDQDKFDDELSEQCAEFPQWLKEEIRLEPIDVSLIVGYVLYKNETGREDGFLIHADDEEGFLELWNDVNFNKKNLSLAALIHNVILRYNSMKKKRLSLQGLISSVVALANNRAEYICLKNSFVDNHVVPFLSDVELSNDNIDELRKRSGEIYCIIKFTLDEIYGETGWTTLYNSDKEDFEKAKSSILNIKTQRGLELRKKIHEEYERNLRDTSLTEYEWERFCIGYIKADTNILYFDERCS